MKKYIVFLVLIIFSSFHLWSQDQSFNIGLRRGQSLVSGSINQNSSLNFTLEVDKKGIYDIFFELNWSNDYWEGKEGDISEELIEKIKKIKLRDVVNKREVLKTLPMYLYYDLFNISYVLEPGTYAFSLAIDAYARVDFSMGFMFNEETALNMSTSPELIINEQVTASSGKNYIIAIAPQDSVKSLNLLEDRLALHYEYSNGQYNIKEISIPTSVQIQYFDGLGRPVQTVQRGITPSGADLVTLQEYDTFGRESNSWLPAVIPGNNGAYALPDKISAQAVSGHAGDQKPYAMPVYEASPLNRVLKQYGPGSEWHNQDKAAKIFYMTNKGGNSSAISDLKLEDDGLLSGTYPACKTIRLMPGFNFKATSDKSLHLYIDPSLCQQPAAQTLAVTSNRPALRDEFLQCDKYNVINNILNKTGYYNGGELYVTLTMDEEDNQSLEFKDKLGQVVLSRQINGDEKYDTYYVYDDFGLLRYVLPPIVNDKQTSLADTDEAMKQYAYLYKYDNRNRCIAKKVPGCEWIYYVYDKADRLIFTQDGEQRKDGKNEWTFSIPDAFGRVVVAGICKNTLDYTADPLKNVIVKADRQNANNTYKGYGAPTEITLTGPTILSVNYYDDYAFMSYNGIPAITDANIKPETVSGYGTQYTGGYKGLLTGALTAQFTPQGTIDNTYLYSVMYYDDRGRVIQTKSTNHLRGIEKEYIAYNFTGQPTKKLHIHTKNAQGGGKQTEAYTYTYDHAGRLLTTTHQLTDGTTVKPQVTLAENSYDELGRLKTNKKGGRAELNTTFTYNVRSWTKSINSPLFSQTLFYNDKVTAHTYPDYQPAYNGNISGMEWQVKDDIKRSYRFKYDNLSRLTHAGYNGVVSGGMYNSYYEYDKHGNITVLDRRGKKSLSETSNELVDQLKMTYNGNQLTKVSDAIPNFAFAQSADFKNYGGSNAAYTYNKNGAMESDLHKGITRIQYNSLNLPYELLIKNTEVSGKVYYTYSASGVKLKTKHMKAKNLGYQPVTGTAGDANLDVVKTTDYVGNMVYENNALKRILVDGGYIENNIYHFYQTDHLGNNRVVADKDGTPIQKNHYYPFGMAFAEGTTLEQGKQPYKYNGKELDQMHGLNLYDYSARYMDAAIGRFTTVDPLAEKHFSVSPYVYALNNPMRYIDPLGMDTINIYQSDGNIHSTRAGGNDVFYIVDSNGNVIQRDGNPVSISFDSKIVSSQSSESLVTNNGTYSYDLYNISDQKSATSLYEFLADNTAVEWSHGVFNDGSNKLTTSHKERSETGMIGVFNNIMIKGFYPVIFNHSHPSGNTVPSGLVENGNLGDGDTQVARDIEYNINVISKGSASFPSYNIYIPKNKRIGNQKYIPFKSNWYNTPSTIMGGK